MIPALDGAVLLKLDDADHLLDHVPPIIDGAFQLNFIRDFTPLRELRLCALANVVEASWVVAADRNDSPVEIAHLQRQGRTCWAGACEVGQGGRHAPAGASTGGRSGFPPGGEADDGKGGRGGGQGRRDGANARTPK